MVADILLLETKTTDRTYAHQNLGPVLVMGMLRTNERTISCENAHLMVRKRRKISCGPVSNFQYAMALYVYVDCSAVNLTLRSQTMSIEFI